VAGAECTGARLQGLGQQRVPCSRPRIKKATTLMLEWRAMEYRPASAGAQGLVALALHSHSLPGLPHGSTPCCYTPFLTATLGPKLEQ
jgi:hypothetical protein